MCSEDGFSAIAEYIKAVIAEFQAELVFAFGVKTAVTSVAGRESRVLL